MREIEAIVGLSGLLLIGVGGGYALYSLAEWMKIPWYIQFIMAGTLMYWAAVGMRRANKR